MTRHHDNDPQPGSAAAEELSKERAFAYSDENTPVQTCFSLATLRTSAAADQLASTGVLIQREVHPYGPAATARVALECSARAWWLLEENLGPEGRALRGIVEQFDSLRAGGKLPEEPGQEQRDKLDRRVLDLEAAGYDVGRNDLGALTGAINGVAVPKAIDLLHNQLGVVGEVAYRVLSAQAHGTSYGLAQGVREVPSDEGPGRDPRPGSTWVQTVPVAEAFLHWTIIGVADFSSAFMRQLSLFGWDSTDWISFDHEATALMGQLQLSARAGLEST